MEMKKAVTIQIAAITVIILIASAFIYFIRKSYMDQTADPTAEHKVVTTVVFETNKGTFKIGLYDEEMPITTDNFKKLASEGFYDGVTFHRVIAGFMIQGGDPDGTGMGGPGYTIKDEFTNDNKNLRGTISMANGGSNTGGSQFFINVADNNALDEQHPVFGEVTEGMDIVDAIVSVETGEMDKPLEDIVITKAIME